MSGIREAFRKSALAVVVFGICMCVACQVTDSRGGPTDSQRLAQAYNNAMARLASLKKEKTPDAAVLAKAEAEATYLKAKMKPLGKYDPPILVTASKYTSN